MRINNNLMAMNTHRQLGINANAGSKSIEKLSSGYRINRAGDDAAGLAISEKMRGQIRGLNQASRNSQDAISLVQTAEGALNESQAILQRMRELAVQSANDTNVGTDRTAIQNEIDQLTTEIDRIGNTTEFNTRKLLNGGASVSGTFAEGAGTAGNVEVIGGTGDTTVGTVIQFDAVTAADAAVATGTADLSGGALTSAASMSINGVSFSFANAETTDNVIDTINNAGVGVTAAMNGNFLELTSSDVGSSATIDIESLNGAAFAGFADAVGADATITPDGTPATAAFSQYSAQGNIITIEDGAAKGLQLKITADETVADQTVTVDANGSLTMQIGANEGQNMNVSLNDMRSAALGVDGVDITSASSASSAITTINDAITAVSTERAKLGAVQNRLEHTIKNLDTSSENLQASESRIRDVDMAKEMMEFTKNNILQQAAQSMLAQANQAPQGVLQLLR
jgi:flagellin